MQKELHWPEQTDHFSCGTLATSAAALLLAGTMPNVAALSRLRDLDAGEFNSSDPEQLRQLRRRLLLIWLIAVVTVDQIDLHEVD